MSLKQKTINGLTWSFIDQFGNQGITFFISIFLARLLTPREFGQIGMITVFIAVSQSFINSGFKNALIRKKIVLILISPLFFISIFLLVYFSFLFCFSQHRLLANFLTNQSSGLSFGF